MGAVSGQGVQVWPVGVGVRPLLRLRHRWSRQGEREMSRANALFASTHPGYVGSGYECEVCHKVFAVHHSQYDSHVWNQHRDKAINLICWKQYELFNRPTPPNTHDSENVSESSSESTGGEKGKE